MINSIHAATCSGMANSLWWLMLADFTDMYCYTTDITKSVLLYYFCDKTIQMFLFCGMPNKHDMVSKQTL